MGLDEERLFKISKKEYFENNIIELKKEKQEIIDKRYEHYEKRRLDSIEAARQIRNAIIENSSTKTCNSKNSTKGFKKENEAQKDPTILENEIIKKELEKLELLKKQQLSEIKNLIDYEYDINETRKKNEQKDKEKKEKDEKKRQEKMKLQKLKIKIRNEKEEEKKEKKKQEEKENLKKYIEQEKKNEKEKKQEEERQKKHLLEKLKKQEEQQKAFEEIREKIKLYKAVQLSERYIKKEKLIEKENKRKKMIEEKKKKDNELKKRQQEDAKERIKKVIERNENELQKKKKEFENKQKEINEKKKLQEKQEEEIRKHHEEELKRREEKIKIVLKTNEELIQKKIDDYNAKQEKLKNLQLKQEERKKKELHELSQKRKEKEEKNILTRQKNAELIMNRKKKLIEKFSHSAERIKKQKEDNDKEITNKYLLAAMKREDTFDNLLRFEKMREIKRQNQVKQIEKRAEKFENFHNQKERIKSTKKQLGTNLTLRKRLLKDKVSSILFSGKYNSKEDIYKKVFNEDELQTLGRNNKKKAISMNATKNENGFFVTQTNNITNEN